MVDREQKRRLAYLYYYIQYSISYHACIGQGRRKSRKKNTRKESTSHEVTQVQPKDQTNKFDMTEITKSYVERLHLAIVATNHGHVFFAEVCMCSADRKVGNGTLRKEGKEGESGPERST